MDELEYAYYLDEWQLLFLLSLIDQRPVAGIFRNAPKTLERGEWQRVALSLLQDRRLYYEGTQLSMEKGLAALLMAMKNAQRVLSVYSKKGACLVRLIYSGKSTAVVEILEGGGFRLHGAERPVLQWLSAEGILPARMEPEELLSTLDANDALRAQMSRWEAQGIPWDAPAIHWGGLPEVQCVIECVVEQERKERWIWVDDPLAGLVLHQERRGIHADLDTESRRRQLIREWGLEAEDAVS